MGSFSPMEQWVFNQTLGQIEGQPSQKEKLSGDMALAQQYSDYTESPITSEWDWLRKDPQGYAEAMKLKASLTAPDKTAWEVQVGHLLQARKDELITDDELKKGMGVYIAPENVSEFDKKFELAKKMNLSDNEWKKFFGVYLDEEEGEANKVQYYKTADECIANAPKIKDMTVDPTFSAKGWYPNYTKETKEDPNNYLFGKKDVYGNISRMGIIPYDAQMAISYGTPLTEEQKTQIKNNHNVQKSLLNEEQLPKIEAILKQIGIDLNAPEPVPVPEPQPKSNIIGDMWKKLTEPGGTPPYQATPKDYSKMTEDELKQAVLAGDTKAIEEAKKRGFLK